MSKTIYRQDAYGNRHVVDEDIYRADYIRYGKKNQIIINTATMIVYRPPVAPNMVKAMPKVQYGGFMSAERTGCHGSYSVRRR